MRLSWFSIAFVPLLAGAGLSSSSFTSLRAQAVPLDRPGAAIAALVGACDRGDAVDQLDCEKNVQHLKDQVKGKRVHLDLGGGHEKLLTFERRDGATARFVWTPLYDVGNGLALTIGMPQKLAPNGNVVVARHPLDGKVDDDVLDTELDRAARLGQIGIEVVGRFGKPWRLANKSQVARGITFEAEAVRLYHVRTGKTLCESDASWMR